MTPTLWISNRGVCSCEAHGGDYLSQYLRHHAPADSWEIHTPLDHWLGVTASDAAAEGLACDRLEDHRPIQEA